ncbi:MAG: Flp pilus assembly protein CpaB [Candidatus Omnitrophica bacterium]|nr:Flp pilus assembly protein CpaB [Candidatus Omnitrophota bacterium]
MAFENKKQLLIIVGAVAAGIVAVILTSNYVKISIEGKTTALAEKYDAQQKQMAAQILQRSDQQMAAIAQELERVKAQEAANMQKQTAAIQAAQQAAMQAAQQVARAPQQPAFQAAKSRKSSLAVKTPVGKRAVTVKIDSLAAVGGLINPGDFVDVIAHLNVLAQDTDKKNVTAMIFQSLQVLAINTNEDDPGAYDEQQAAVSLKITFAVDPQEAGLLAFADKNGSLELALRSPDDSDHKKVKASTWKTLADYVLKNQGVDIQNPDGVSETKPEGNKLNIQIFRGGKEL